MSHSNTTANQAVYINECGICCALGDDLQSVANNLFSTSAPQRFLTVTDQYSPGRALPLALINSELEPTASSRHDSRNNQILAKAMAPLLTAIDVLKAQYGQDRIGIIVGTSTSGIAEGEAAMFFDGDQCQLKSGYAYPTQELSAPANFLSQWLGLTGPCWSVSSACTSGAKALASASRLLRLGVCDAVICGGVDSLCQMTVAGFSSLTVTSEQPCNPFSRNRDGINLGEAAAMFIVSREPGPVRLAGYGESSDAYHISSPHPEGIGAKLAMQRALTHSGISASEIDYINLHGTATMQNDSMEAMAVNAVFQQPVACGSTKGLSGHTLAAAGALEAAFCWLALQRDDGLLPPHRWDGQPDTDTAMIAGLAQTHCERPLGTVMSNSFAFGGNNISLLLTAA